MRFVKKKDYMMFQRQNKNYQDLMPIIIENDKELKYNR